MDIKDFFPSVKPYFIYSVYRDSGYSKAVAGILTGLCVYEDVLPQGAPTSPPLSNLICRRIDARLGGLSRKLGIRYTRYSDDMTFSGSFEPGHVVKSVRTIISEYGFELNEKKTRVSRPHQRQCVTGVVVNSKIQAPRTYRRELRKQIHYIDQYGLQDHMKRGQLSRANYVEYLVGVAHHVLFLNPEDRDALHALEVLRRYRASPVSIQDNGL